MRLTTLLPVFLSSMSLTSARPADIGPETYKVTKYSPPHSCTPGGCSYHFNISALAPDHTKYFHTYCHGDSEDPTPCDLKNLTSTITQLKHPYWNVKIQHAWSSLPDGEPAFHFDMQSASKNVTDEETSFSLPVDPKSRQGVSKRGN